MSKALMISIKPEWCELIAKKEKTIEVRKTRPKIKTPFKCYIYETKGLYRGSRGCLFQGSGKVIGEYVCDRICPIAYTMDGFADIIDCELSCLKPQDFIKYGKGKTLYGWHISNLVIYDKPKEISEFRKATKKCFYDDLGCAIPNCDDCTECNITKPPQSWCYVEVENA